MWLLRAWLLSTPVASSASDHFQNCWEGKLHLSNMERVALRWVIVLWGCWKYQYSSIVFIWQRWCTYIWCLGPDLSPQPSPQAHLIVSIFSWRGSCICQTWKGSPWGELLSSEDAENISIHPLYPLNDVDALTVDVWGQIPPHSRCLKRIWSFSFILGGGAVFVKPRKGRPEVSYCPLRMLKISVFIHCIHLIKWMHLQLTSEGWISPHSLRLKHIWSFPI